MKPIQWIFHYLEICKNQKRDLELEIRKLRAGSSEVKKAIKYLMIVTDGERGKKAVELMEEEEIELAKFKNGEIKPEENNGNNSTGQGEDKPLRPEDQELWDFMMSTPETMALPEQARMTRDYVVEAKSLADVAEDLGLIGVSNTDDEVVDEIKEFKEEDNDLNDIEVEVKKPMIIQSISNSDDNLSLGFEELE